MSLDTRYWTREFVNEFIEAYKRRPCLWNMRCQEYTNKILKREAYEEMAQLCKKVHKDADDTLVKGKIQGLRAAFRKESRKVDSCLLKGEVYRPRLWYYDLLLFTKDQDNNSNAIEDMEYSSLQEFYDVMGIDDQNEDNSNIAHSSSEKAQQDSPTMTHSSHEKGQKRKYPSEEASESKLLHIKEEVNIDEDFQPPDTVFVNAGTRSEEEYTTSFCDSSNKHNPYSGNTSRINFATGRSSMKPTAANIYNIDDFRAVGINVAAKLKKMDDRQAILAEHLISQILCKGLLMKLTEETTISQD
ncbi:hypothetical protein HHI36_020237 [Cryptolaemus montrouzieri]|uniref:MADF domain-containing protein n=1 Tax=Cryptolaemus montrouzieri TaxID=559131 RepID=A0ABD2NA11_9CUCU